MIIRIIAAIILITLGTFIFSEGYRAWCDNSARSYSMIESPILSHEMLLDDLRWKGKERAALVVESRVQASTSSAGLEKSEGPRFREFFERADQAWDFVSAHPVGSLARGIISPPERFGKWESRAPSGGMIAMITGGVLMLFGICSPLPFAWGHFASYAGLTAFCLAFSVAGIFAAWGLWPSALRQVRARHWPSVSYEKIGERTRPSGKSSTTESAIQYTFSGTNYVTVLTEGSFSMAPAQTPAGPPECRVNPDKPWQATLSWGWRPSLGVVLFPIPFLAVGVGGLGIALVPALRRWFKESNQRGQGSKASLDEVFPVWGKVLGHGFALAFAGSIVGVFVSFCAEMWIRGHGMKWFLTIFLIPFILVVLKLLSGFFSALWQALRS